MRKVKIFSVVLSILLTFSLFIGCGGEKTKETKTVNEIRALELTKNVRDKFWVEFEGDNYFTEYSPAKNGEVSKAFLWSYFGALGMQYQLCKLYPQDETIKNNYKDMLDALKYYKSGTSTDTVVKYHSGRGVYPNRGAGDVFFDDNIWVARNLLFAHEIFGDKSYLDEAIRVVNFIYTGWNNEIGGLVWNERGLTDNATEQELERGLSANACCIIVNAKIYELTKEESYLTWANKFYEFCKKTQDSETFIYYNGIHTLIENGVRKNGAVNKALYSYNPGSMILADLDLYELTKDEAYLLDAKRSATAAYNSFKMLDLGVNITYYRDYVWFTAIMMESFTALKAYDAELVSPYIEVFSKSLDYAYKHYKNVNGFLSHDYAAGYITVGSDANDRSLLTQSGTAEIYVLLAICEKIK